MPDVGVVVSHRPRNHRPHLAEVGASVWSAEEVRPDSAGGWRHRAHTHFVWSRWALTAYVSQGARGTSGSRLALVRTRCRRRQRQTLLPRVASFLLASLQHPLRWVGALQGAVCPAKPCVVLCISTCGFRRARATRRDPPSTPVGASALQSPFFLAPPAKMEMAFASNATSIQEYF